FNTDRPTSFRGQHVAPPPALVGENFSAGPGQGQHPNQEPRPEAERALEPRPSGSAATSVEGYREASTSRITSQWQRWGWHQQPRTEFGPMAERADATAGSPAAIRSLSQARYFPITSSLVPSLPMWKGLAKGEPIHPPKPRPQ